MTDVATSSTATDDTVVPTLSAITAATDGSAFGLDAHGNAYQMTSTQPDGTGTWTGLTGNVALTQISAARGAASVGSGMDVWGTTASGEVYRSQGATWNPQPVPGTLS